MTLDSNAGPHATIEAPDAATQGRMQRTKRRDTPAEVSLRRELFRRGLRYRIDFRISGTRTRPDIVFTRKRIAIFVDGCFWHSCPDHGSKPKKNAQWWHDKLTANKERDKRNSQFLCSLGWKVIRIWEHVPSDEAAHLVVDALRHASDELQTQ